MRGCTGAGSTQARTLTCMSPPPLALHPCLDLYGFRVLSNSDRAPVFLIFCSCLDQAGARFGLGLARGFLCLLRLSLAWRPSSLEPAGPVQTIRVQGLNLVWLEAARFLQMEPWLDASNPEQMDLDGCSAGSGSKFFLFFRDRVQGSDLGLVRGL